MKFKAEITIDTEDFEDVDEIQEELEGRLDGLDASIEFIDKIK